MKLLSGAAALSLLCVAALPASATAAPIDDLMETVALEPDRIRADIEALTGETGAPPIVSRSIFHPDLVRAEDWLIEQLGAIEGLVVSAETIDVIVPLDGVDVAVEGLRTIIGELPGAGGSPIIVVGAHLDSTAKASPGGWEATSDPAPGADDDASGVAALLSMARSLAGWSGGFDRTIRLVFFTAEEVGLLGSEAYVAGLVADGADIDAMVQLDPVGFNGNGTDILWFAWEEGSAGLRAKADAVATESGTWLDVRGVDAGLIGGDDRSDHFHFWEAGWPALHFGAFPPPPDYHKTTDTLAVVDLEFLAEVTRTTTRLVADLADPGTAPLEAPSDAGCACHAGGASAVPAAGLLVGALAWGTRRRRQ